MHNSHDQHSNAATSPSHVTIDMHPPSSLTPSSASTAPASLNVTHAEVRASHAGRSERSRSRSRRRTPSPAHVASGTTPVRSVRNRRAVNGDSGEPLLHNGHQLDADAEMVPKGRPPTVDTETLDDDEDEEQAHPRLPNTPLAHPGVDEGFFPDDKPKEAADADADADDADGPGFALQPRIGGADSDDGSRSNRGGGGRRGSFPPSSFVPAVAVGPNGAIIPDVNVYQQKKTLAQGMMDLALLSANANQLRYVLESNRSHPYFYVSLVFISMSIILQIAVGVGLIWNSRYNVKDEAEICKADKINNFTVIGIFMITTVNVFITSFGVAAVEQVVVRQ